MSPLLLAAAVAAVQPPSLARDAGHPVSLSRGATVESFQIASTILHETRSILIVLPASFSRSAPDRRYPVTIVLDGEDNVPPVAAVADELGRNGQIPETVIVAIPNTDRLRDLTPPGLSVSGSSVHEGGDRFLDFVEQELLPAVDRQFRGAPPRVFVGHSSGGILVTYAAATRSAFRAIVAIDTPTGFGDNWLPKRLVARAAGATTPLRYASYEVRFGWTDSTWNALVAAAPPSWKLHRERLASESHESAGMLGMYLGLREVFSDYSMLVAPVTPTTSVLPYYDKISATFGGTLVPPRKLLVQAVEDLLAEGRGAAAREAYNLLAFGYGPPANVASLNDRIAEVERRPPPTESVEGLLATPFPSPEEAWSFIGEWIGDIWMGPEQPRTHDVRLRIRVDNGHVIGETVRRTPEGEDVRRWGYMRITPEGMTFGVLNGMRPRGVALFEGTLKGGTLSGTMRFGGIDFNGPDGVPPPLHFSFKRVEK